MFLQNLRAKVGARLNGDKEAGFTLIELLVVMLILGILAAIALPAFFNQRDKAGDSKAKENAHSAQVAIETYATENGGKYTGATNAKLHAIEPTISATPGSAATETAAGVEGIALTGVTDTGYTIESFASNGHVFSISNALGTMTFTCTPPGKGGCPAAVGTASTGDWSK